MQDLPSRLEIGVEMANNDLKGKVAKVILGLCLPGSKAKPGEAVDVF